MVSGSAPACKSFDELQPGDAVEFSVTISPADHEAFKHLTGDDSPIHQSPDFARSTVFERPIGYGFHLSSLLSRLYGMLLPGGSSICIRQDSQFIKPFFPGDTIRVQAKVTKKIQSTKFVEVTSEMFRSSSECVFRGVGIVQVLFSRSQLMPLYRHDDRILYIGDFLRSLEAAGIRSGDTLFVHSDIGVFGKLATFDRNALLQAHIDLLRKAVGNQGTLVFPTFTYSFCKGEPFDPRNSPSTVGILTEYFRAQPGVVRSNHPIFSVAAQGPLADELCNVGSDSFDMDSIFGKLRTRQAKILFLGAPFHSCTFVHHIEQMHGIPYRYMKTFAGTIRGDGGDFPAEATYFVHYIDNNIQLDLQRFEHDLIAQGLMSSHAVGAGTVLCVSAEGLFAAGFRHLDANPFFFLKEPVA